MIDSRSTEVLSSDALLSLPLDVLQDVAQRTTLHAREVDIGRGLLRWLRHCRFASHSGDGAGHVEADPGRALVLNSLRLLTMTAKEVKKLDLATEGVLRPEELEAVLRLLHHGCGPLPAELEEYRDYWQCPRDGGKTSRGLLKRLVERTRGGGHGGQDVADSAERREALRQKRSRRADKVKMALATGASFIFD